MSAHWSCSCAPYLSLGKTLKPYRKTVHLRHCRHCDLRLVSGWSKGPYLLPCPWSLGNIRRESRRGRQVFPSRTGFERIRIVCPIFRLPPQFEILEVSAWVRRKKPCVRGLILGGVVVLGLIFGYRQASSGELTLFPHTVATMFLTGRYAHFYIFIFPASSFYQKSPPWF